MYLNSRLTRWVWTAWRQSISRWVFYRIGNAMTCVGWPNSNSRNLNLWVSVDECRNIEEHCGARTSGGKAEGEVSELEHTMIWITMNRLFIQKLGFLCSHFYYPSTIDCMWDTGCRSGNICTSDSFEVSKVAIWSAKYISFFRKGIDKNMKENLRNFQQVLEDYCSQDVRPIGVVENVHSKSIK